jgi:hypothetical protein
MYNRSVSYFLNNTQPSSCFHFYVTYLCAYDQYGKIESTYTQYYLFNLSL